MPELALIDTHAHLDMDAFDTDREGVLSRAQAAGVKTVITVGIDIASSRAAIGLAERHPGVLATVGFHPGDADRMSEADIAELERLAEQPRVVAIGETGLDFYRDRSSREAQMRAFEWQLELAIRLDLPVIIHCREAEKELLDVLQEWTSRHRQSAEYPRGVIHCFQGNTDAARQYLEMGFFLSLGGYISYPSSRKNHQTIRSLPLDRLVVETDCPFLPPQAHRGQRNEPAYLPLTVQALAEIRGVTPETVAEATTRNAIRLFRLEKHGTENPPVSPLRQAQGRPFPKEGGTSNG